MNCLCSRTSPKRSAERCEAGSRRIITNGKCYIAQGKIRVFQSRSQLRTRSCFPLGSFFASQKVRLAPRPWRCAAPRPWRCATLRMTRKNERCQKPNSQINQNLKIIIYFCLKFFEGFLGETFFQESSPKRVPYKSKFLKVISKKRARTPVF